MNNASAALINYKSQSTFLPFIYWVNYPQITFVFIINEQVSEALPLFLVAHLN